MDRFDLSGRTALVTGGSRGIGRAAAQALAEAGADVIVASRNEASCRRAADEIAAATGRRAFAAQLRVANELTALRRAGAPEEVAWAIVYLASDAASYTSGALLRVDGGWQP